MGISVLSTLEPLLGASLALNLAYLNLGLFRYRDKIAYIASEKITNAPETVFSTAWYKEIRSLADQRDNDPPKLRLPNSFWGVIYRPLFHWQADRIVAAVFTAISIAYLYLGVAHEVGMYPEHQGAFSASEIWNELIYATSGLMWPVLMILSASYCKRSCQSFIQYQLNDIKKAVIKDGTADIAAATAEFDAIFSPKGD